MKGSTLRLDMTAEYSQALETLERLVAFARVLEALGLEVRITGEVGVVVETVAAQTDLGLEPDAPRRRSA